MNAQTIAMVNKPQRLSALLGQVATIATVKSTSLGMTRTDKQASREADRAHNALGGTSKVVVSRLTGSGEARVKAINQLVTQVSSDLKFMTTAWNDQRLLANAMLQQWLAIWGKAKAEHTKLVDEFIRDAPVLIAEASANLGSFNVAPPTEDEIRSAFSLDFDMQQIPDSENYHANGLSASLETEMKRRFEAGIAAAYQNATTDALTRVAEPLGRLAERMQAYSQREADKAKGLSVSKEGTFKDSIISNVQDIAAVFRSFNLTGDPLMTKVADALDQFDGIEADDLRASPELRNHVAKKADEILADLSDLI
jgi:hypothetical protein